MGSSEKYSKSRPQRGLRWMFRPGPSRTATSCAAASSPSASPTASPSFSSQLHAVAEEVGKQVAGTLGLRPRWSAAPACLRTPLGPSERVMAGMPLPGRARVVKTVSPESRAHFCSKFRVWIISACFIKYYSCSKKKGGGRSARRPFRFCVTQTVLMLSSFFLRKRKMVRMTRTAIRPPQTPSTA